jgi:acyl carrier protein
MNKNAVKNKLVKVLNKSTGVDISTINPEGNLREQINLDSMQIVSIIAQIEEEFKIDVPMTIMGVKSFNEFLKIVEKAIKEKND